MNPRKQRYDIEDQLDQTNEKLLHMEMSVMRGVKTRIFLSLLLIMINQ